MGKTNPIQPSYLFFFLMTLIVLVTGCTHILEPSSRYAVKVSLPAPVVMDQVHQSITLVPTLELKNTSGDILGMAFSGPGKLGNFTVAYEIFDSAGSKLPVIQSDWRGSTLAGTRLAVGLLKPGESYTWSPLEVFSYTVSKKGKYRMIVHLDVSGLDDRWLHYYAPQAPEITGQQISKTTHHFDSDAFTFSVD